MVRCNADPETKIPMPITLNMNRQTLIQLRGALTAVTSGSTFNTYLGFDPSSSTTAGFGSATLFAEWSAIASLYARIKLVQFEIVMSPAYIDDTKGDVYTAMFIAASPVATLANPGSYATVADNNDSIMWNPVADKSGVAKYFSYKPRGLGWGPVGTPGGTTGLGCPGSFVFYSNSLPITIEIFTAKVVGTYLLDNRV